jgi:hypothetical protein
VASLHFGVGDSGKALKVSPLGEARQFSSILSASVFIFRAFNFTAIVVVPNQSSPSRARPKLRVVEKRPEVAVYGSRRMWQKRKNPI